MKIALINASPKTGRSASASLLADLSAFFSGSASLVEIGLHDATLPGQFLQEPRSELLQTVLPLIVWWPPKASPEKDRKVKGT